LGERLECFVGDVPRGGRSRWCRALSHARAHVVGRSIELLLQRSRQCFSTLTQRIDQHCAEASQLLARARDPDRVDHPHREEASLHR